MGTAAEIKREQEARGLRSYCNTPSSPTRNTREVELLILFLLRRPASSTLAGVTFFAPVAFIAILLRRREVHSDKVLYSPREYGADATGKIESLKLLVAAPTFAVFFLRIGVVDDD